MDKKQKTLRELWRFVRPESEELVAYFTTIIIMASISFYSVIVQNIAPVEAQDILSSLRTIQANLQTYLTGNDTLAQLFLFGFWFIIGTIVYIIAWSVVTFLVDSYNNIHISSAFVHPRSFHQSDYWAAIVGRTVLRTAAAGALVFYAVFWLIAFAPVWIGVMDVVMDKGFTLEAGLSLLTTLAGIALSLHVAAILLRLVLLRAHYTYDA